MFGRSITILRLFGFEIKVNIGWAFIAILIAWSLAQGYFPQLYEGLPPQTYWWMGLGGMLGLFVSIVLHELAHSLVARAFGMDIKGITLWLLGGAAELGDEPPSARAEFLMAIAGPIMSVALAGVFLGAATALGTAGATPPFEGVLRYLALLNMVLAIFNMVPAFPLDGGRVLRSILWAIKGDLHWATWLSSRIGTWFGLAAIALGILTAISGYLVQGFWWVILGMFIRFAADASYHQLEVSRTLADKTVRSLMTSNAVTVPPDITLDELVNKWVYRHYHEFFPVVDGDRLLGSVGREEIKQADQEKWGEVTVADVMTPAGGTGTISPEEDAVHALRKMQENTRSRLMVVEGERLVGVLTLKDMMRLISLKMDLEKP